MLLNQSAMLLKEVRLCYILSQSEMVILNYYTIIFQYGVIISSLSIMVYHWLVKINGQ